MRLAARLFRTIGIAGLELVFRALDTPRVVRAMSGRDERRVTVMRELHKGPILIFACYPRSPLEPSMLAALSAFARRGVQVVVASNRYLPPEIRGPLERFASIILERKDGPGRDFGSYQAATRYVDETISLRNVERLIYLNDSIYFFRDANLDALIEFMLDPAQEYCATTENFEFHYHVGSYFFALGPRIIRSAFFAEFWQRYVPYSTRRNAIHGGEVKLCKTIIGKGYEPQIAYSIAGLAGRFEALLEEGNRCLFSLRVRRQVWELASATAPPSAGRERAVAMEASQNGNQSHHLGLAFVQFAGAPFLKKDVVFRGTYLLSELVEFTRINSLDDPDGVVAVFRQRGTEASLRGGWQRLLARWSFI